MEQRLLVISHGHPHFNRGGGEYAAYAIHQHIGALPGWRSLFLAAAPDNHLASPLDLEQVGHASEWLMRPTEDWLLFESVIDLASGSALHQLIESWQPTVIHWHHFHRVGIDALLAISRWCPDARVVFTLHEFLALCPYQGQLLTTDGIVCSGPRLDTCASCLPAIDSADLQLRDGLMRRLMAEVDAWIAPSQQLADLYVAWGLDHSRIEVVEYALPEPLMRVYEQCSSQVELRASSTEPPLRFGYLGNVLPSKGLDVILMAFCEVVHCYPNAQLSVFAPVPTDWSDRHPSHHPFYERLQMLLKLLENSVVLVGGYGQGDVPRLMQQVDWLVMGSLWRENSPVVILEAKACRRPLLVPALGGMQEKVRNGVDGWHYTPGDPVDLASVMKRCCQSRGEWKSIVDGMAGPISLELILDDHLDLYTCPSA